MDPRLLQLLRQVPARRFDDGGDVDFDLGGFDAGDFDIGDIDLSGLFGDTQDYSDTVDYESLFGDQTGGGDAGETVDMLTRGLTGGDAGEDFANLFGDISGDQLINLDELNQLIGTDYSATGGADLGSFEDLAASEQQSKLQDLFGSSIQDLGAKGTLTDEGLLQIGGYDQPGGMTSQWQTSGSDRIMIQDDGSAIGINTETGESYDLSPKEVDQMVKNGQLNTFGSGYNTATGGNRLAPGGGKEVTTKDGKKVIVKPDGTVLDKETLKIVNNSDTIKDAINRAIGGGSSTGTKTGTQSNLSWLLPLLLMMAMRDKGSTGSGAVIPKLSAERTALPYQQIQQAPGYRPGQGGVRYVSDVQYKPMARGGIADLAVMARGGTPVGGKLLQGPGDGVSDSIPATIGGTQPARLARGEFVVDARTVSELGNGSTDAGAEKLYKMMDRVHKARKKAGRGKDSRSDKYLPA